MLKPVFFSLFFLFLLLHKLLVCSSPSGTFVCTSWEVVDVRRIQVTFDGDGGVPCLN